MNPRSDLTMKTRRLFSLLLSVLLILSAWSAGAEGLQPLDMDSTAIAPAPKDECYLSDNEYQDESIHVTIEEGDFEEVHYFTARIKISHPSQLRTTPGYQTFNPEGDFTSGYANEPFGRDMASVANAVVAINGDYFTKQATCHICLRQGAQIRNIAHGRDALAVNREGDMILLPGFTKEDYKAYYTEHGKELYQVFCFGPALVTDGKSVIPEGYQDPNAEIISMRKTQRVAICQIGPLEYAIVVCDGDALFYTYGLTLDAFARLCEKVGNEMSPEGFKIAYNLDGGNSATLVFKRKNEEGQLVYQKLNMPERERGLADMICFVSLVQE